MKATAQNHILFASRQKDDEAEQVNYDEGTAVVFAGIEKKKIYRYFFNKENVVSTTRFLGCTTLRKIDSVLVY